LPATQKTGSQESEFRSQNEQPEENIQYHVPPCGIPQSGRISNVQGEQPGARMGTGNSEDIGTELKNGGRLLTQLPDKQSVHGVNFKNV